MKCNIAFIALSFLMFFISFKMEAEGAAGAARSTGNSAAAGIARAAPGEDEGLKMDIINAALPDLAGLVGMCVTSLPLGPILVGSLGLIHVASIILTDDRDGDEQSKALTRVDLMQTQNVILDAIEDLGEKFVEQSQKLLLELRHTIQKTSMMEQMRLDLAALERTHSEKMKVLLNPKVTGVQKNATIAMLLDNDSNFMERLRSFTDRYIKPKVVLPTSDKIKLFYELTLESDRLLALNNVDNYTESMQSKIFKAFMYICKTLTEGYVMPIVAHAVQYQAELKSGLVSDAEATKANAEVLIEYFRNDMKGLIDKTKLILKDAPREIRLNPSFLMIKGETFERLSFVQQYPYISSLTKSECVQEEILPNLKDYEQGTCNLYKNEVPSKSKISLFYNVTDERPFHYMNVKTPDGNEQTFGHPSSSPNLMNFESTIEEVCPLGFCTLYRKNAVGVSLKRVSADPGNVIVGLRFRVEDGVIYIDIQQAKFVHILAVDDSKSHWTKTPPGGPVHYFNSNTHKLEIGNFELNDNEFLTAIQFIPQRKGREFFVSVGYSGSKPPQWYSLGIQNSQLGYGEFNEISVPDVDDPEKYSFNTITNSTQLNEDQRNLISFIPTDLMKDMGRTTYPYIDLRPVESNPQVPLNGFGIYLTNQGLLSLKLITPKLDYLADYTQIQRFTENT